MSDTRWKKLLKVLRMLDSLFGDAFKWPCGEDAYEWVQEFKDER